MSDQHPPPAKPATTGYGSSGPEGIARDLTGDLPCVNCRYNLRGLSIRLSCPECGVPVLATILDVVDPQARELQPIASRRLVAWGFVLWSSAALGAAIILWLIRAGDAADLIGWTIRMPRSAGLVAAIAILLSGLGAAALIAPHANLPRYHRLSASSAVLAYLILAVVVWWTIDGSDSAMGFAFLTSEPMLPSRHLLRLVTALLIVAIIFGLRPNARTLAARSLIVRTGRVDRQSMYPLAWSILIASAGDVIGLAVMGAPGPVREAAMIGITLLIALGSALFTLGLWGILLDTIRLMPVILAPPMTYHDLVSTPESSPDD